MQLTSTFLFGAAAMVALVSVNPIIPTPSPYVETLTLDAAAVRRSDISEALPEANLLVLRDIAKMADAGDPGGICVRNVPKSAGPKTPLLAPPPSASLPQET